MNKLVIKQLQQTNKFALKVFANTGKTEYVNEISKYLQHPNPKVKASAKQAIKNFLYNLTTIPSFSG